jgi:hypothetical protein
MEILEYFLAQNLNKATEGQSTVEFALTMTLFMGFTFFLLRVCLVFSFGNYVQYATFMAARSYLSAGKDVSDQEKRARFVLGYMLKRSAYQTRADKFPSIAKGFKGADSDFPGLDLGPGSLYREGSDDTLWMLGVRYTFTSKLFPIAIGKLKGAGSAEAKGEIELTSESWLGKEPSADECISAMEQINGIFDNGC